MTTFVSFVSINNNIVYANVDSWSTLVVCLFVAIDTVFFSILGVALRIFDGSTSELGVRKQLHY